MPEAEGEAIEATSADEGLRGPARNAVVREPVTAEQRKVVLSDPLVQQVLELFDGAVVNIERSTPASAPEAGQTTE